jgi:hypothetical protein
MASVGHWIEGLEAGVSPLVLAGGALALTVAIVALIMMARGRGAKASRKSFKAPAVADAKYAEPLPSGLSHARSASNTLWPAAIAIASLAVALFVATRPSGDPAAMQRFDNRSAELTMRALAPGSPLACLDAIGSAAIEASCEKAVFASPETLAAAVAYVDARLSLFVEGREAGKSGAAGDSFERLRRTIEQDRYGLVAHVLATRGCEPDNCPTLKLMRDPSQVLSNLKDRTFDSNVVLHAASWRSDFSTAAVAPVAGVPAPAAPPLPAMPTASGSSAPSPPTPSSPSKFEFPSAASIPAISIMNAEPAQPPAAARAEQPPTAARPAAASRRQSARETTSQSPGPPVQIAPDAPPAPAGTLANPGGPPR